MKKLLVILMGSAAFLTAQPQPVDVPTPMIFPPPVSSFSDVKAYLRLSDSQIEQLRQILSDRDKATQSTFNQIRQKQLQIQTLLERGNDAVQIGQLTIDIHDLNKQVSAPDDQYRQRALAVLTLEQKTKLTQLDQVVKQMPAGNQAIQLLLLVPPPPGPPTLLSGQIIAAPAAP